MAKTLIILSAAAVISFFSSCALCAEPDAPAVYIKKSEEENKNILEENKINAGEKFTIKELIVKHARELDLDPALALSIAKAESNYRHDKTSRYGAVGVFQLMPSTAAKMGYNPYLLNDNIKAGIVYYKKMYKIFGSMKLALAAYNAGPGNVKKYRGIPPFKETQRFVDLIMDSYIDMKLKSDPAIESADSKIKEINSRIADDIFRKKQEEAVQAFLSSQGV